MNILINGIGGPTPRSIAMRIRELYPDCNIIGVDANPKALGFYMKGLLNAYYVIPRAKDSAYWTAIEKIISKHQVDLAFVQPEAEVIAWGEYHQQHSKYPCPVFIPPLAYAVNLMDKANMSDILKDTVYIPKTIRITPTDPQYDNIASTIGYPCWIRATVGSGGFGSLKLNRKEDLEAWLFIHSTVKEFTVSEFLPGRHLANQMMYVNGKCIMNGGLECVEYVMADVAPSKVTGNTSYGRLVNNKELLSFCEACIDYIAGKLGVEPHGVLSFDLKEDQHGQLKVTEVNIRHMAYTGIMAKAGFDLVDKTIQLLTKKLDINSLNSNYQFEYNKNYVFLRDVDLEPIFTTQEEIESKKLTVI